MHFDERDDVDQRITKQYLPMFQPSKQATSDLVQARESLIFPSSSIAVVGASRQHGDYRRDQQEHFDLFYAEAQFV
jgi:hypothetical protein